MNSLIPSQEEPMAPPTGNERERRQTRRSRMVEETHETLPTGDDLDVVVERQVLEVKKATVTRKGGTRSQPKQKNIASQLDEELAAAMDTETPAGMAGGVTTRRRVNEVVINNDEGIAAAREPSINPDVLEVAMQETDREHQEQQQQFFTPPEAVDIELPQTEDEAEEEEEEQPVKRTTNRKSSRLPLSTAKTTTKTATKAAGGVQKVQAKNKKKRTASRKKETYKRYVYIILKQIHPHLGISVKGMAVIEAFIQDIFERIVTEASRLTLRGKRVTLGAREIETAVKLVLNSAGQLGVHAVREGRTALAQYNMAGK